VLYTGTSDGGNRYVGYVAALGAADTVSNGCGCSNSMVEDVLMRDVAITGVLDSAACDRLEQQMRLDVGRTLRANESVPCERCGRRNEDAASCNYCPACLAEWREENDARTGKNRRLL
jgi:hypothetical protein